MKALITLFSLIVLLACNKTEKTIVGKWRPVDLGIMGSNETERKGIIDSARIEFTADGKFVNHFGSETYEGTYIVKDSTLETTINNDVQRFTINEKSVIKAFMV